MEPGNSITTDRARGCPAFRWLVWVGMAVLSAWHGAQLYVFHLRQARLPLCDAAIHGGQGYTLACDLRAGALGRFFADAAAQDWWPFGFSLLLVPFQLAADWLGASSYSASTLLVTACYAAIPLVLLRIADEAVGGPDGQWAGAIAGGAFLCAPLPRVYSMLIMREIPGALFLSLVIALYLRASRLRTLAAYRLAGLALILLFFIKYNFGLLALIPFMIAEFFRLDPAKRAQRIASILRTLRPRSDCGWRGYMPAAGLLYAAVVAGWRLAGGNPGDPLCLVLYGVPLFLAGGIALRRIRVAALLAQLAPPWRALVETVIVPLWLWLLIPWNLYSFVDYLHLGSRQRGVIEKFSYLGGVGVHLETFAFHALPPALGCAVLLSFLVCAFLIRRWPEAPRTLLILAISGLLLVVLHPSEAKDPRFLIPGAPVALLAAAVAWVRLARRAAGQSPAAGAALLAALAAVTVGVPLADARLDDRLQAAYRQNTATSVIQLCLDQTATLPDWRRKTAILGGFNQVSAALITWDAQLRTEHPLLKLTHLPRWYAQDKLGAGAWLRRKGAEQIVAIRPLPGCPWATDEDYTTFNAWQLASIAEVEQDPGWKLAHRAAIEEIGLEVLVFEAADGE